MLNDQDVVIDTTVTRADGTYEFNNLTPGTYSVRGIQPTGYFDGGTLSPGMQLEEAAGLVRDVRAAFGVNGLHYDFCELPPGTISGFVFQDGPPIPVTDPEHSTVPDYRDGLLMCRTTRFCKVWCSPCVTKQDRRPDHGLGGRVRRL